MVAVNTIALQAHAEALHMQGKTLVRQSDSMVQLAHKLRQDSATNAIAVALDKICSRIGELEHGVNVTENIVRRIAAEYDQSEARLADRMEYGNCVIQDTGFVMNDLSGLSEAFHNIKMG